MLLAVLVIIITKLFFFTQIIAKKKEIKEVKKDIKAVKADYKATKTAKARTYATILFALISFCYQTSSAIVTCFCDALYQK